jgi:dolichol kinase
MLLERIERFSEFITERKKGELKSSLLLVFGMFAFIITICWGLLGDPYLVLASVYAWGFGDAAAALIGKRFGKHKIRWEYMDGEKRRRKHCNVCAVLCDGMYNFNV